MLYATTRNKSEVETAHKAIHLDCAGDGGLFTPFRLESLDKAQIEALATQSFGQTMAQIVNLFFASGLTGWDVEFAIGRSPVQISTITRRVLVAESWHNSQWRFDHAVQLISDQLRQFGSGEKPSNWVDIAVRIAALFGTYGQMLASGQIEPEAVFDVAVPTGDFSGPMVAWYARRMGMPIGNIICGCNENGGVWDLLHQGQIATGDIAVRTVTKDADVAVPRNLERLVFETLGMEEAHRFVACRRLGGAYELEPEQLEQLRSGMFAAVISDTRVETIIHSVYRTSGYIFGPYSALAYGSLQDYRAKTGESRTALILAERSPTCDVELVAKFLRMDTNQVFRSMSGK